MELFARKHIVQIFTFCERFFGVDPLSKTKLSRMNEMRPEFFNFGFLAGKVAAENTVETVGREIFSIKTFVLSRASF